MLWLSINYWPAMRLAFEIILAIPALLFAAAIIVGARHRRKLRDQKLFEPRIEHGLNIGSHRPPEGGVPGTPPSGGHGASSVAKESRLSESDFEAALIAVEQARARGDHAAADAMLASLHGQGPAPLAQ